MRESKAIATRPERLLVPVHTHSPDAFELADKEITVDGETIRLGDYWPMARYLGDLSRRGDE